MKINNQEFEECEIQEQNHYTYQYQESVRKLFPYLLNHTTIIMCAVFCLIIKISLFLNLAYINLVCFIL